MSDAGEFNEEIVINQGALVTSPPASSVVSAAFGSVLSDGTAKQNTLGYDIILNIVTAFGPSISGRVFLGVGPTNPPATNQVIPSFTTITTAQFNFTAYVPSGYWVVVTSTNTSVSAIGVQAMAV